MGYWGWKWNSSITVGASGVNGGWIFSAALTDQLIEPVAKVLHLTGSQDTTDSHQLGGVWVTPPRTRVGKATNSERAPLVLRIFSGSSPIQARRGCPNSGGWRASKETDQPFWGLAGSSRGGDDVRLAFRPRGFILSLVHELAKKVQPEERQQIMLKFGPIVP